MDGSAPARREVVIPGDLLDGHGLKPGSGTFNEGGRIYAARLGIVSERDGLVSVIPLSGRYIPRSREGVRHTAHAIRLIEERAPLSGLTDLVREYLESAYGRRAGTPAERDGDGGH